MNERTGVHSLKQKETARHGCVCITELGLPQKSTDRYSLPSPASRPTERLRIHSKTACRVCEVHRYLGPIAALQASRRRSSEKHRCKRRMVPRPIKVIGPITHTFRMLHSPFTKISGHRCCCPRPAPAVDLQRVTRPSLYREELHQHASLHLHLSVRQRNCPGPAGVAERQNRPDPSVKHTTALPQ